MTQHVKQVLMLPEVTSSSDGADSLQTILVADLRWNSDKGQFAQKWGSDNRMLRKQLPEIRQAITWWQQRVLDTWEATGYRHDDPDASRLMDQRPLRLQIDDTFIADALDSADLACFFLHTSGSLSMSHVISAAGTYKLSICR